MCTPPNFQSSTQLVTIFWNWGRQSHYTDCLKTEGLGGFVEWGFIWVEFGSISPQSRPILNTDLIFLAPLSYSSLTLKLCFSRSTSFQSRSSAKTSLFSSLISRIRKSITSAKVNRLCNRATTKPSCRKSRTTPIAGDEETTSLVPSGLRRC